jgi:hypothetical protein
MQTSFFARAALGIAALGAALAGCAGVNSLSASSSNDDKTAAVTARAQTRGAALVRGDLDTAYAMLSEGSKAVISRDIFSRRMTIVPFTAYRIEGVSCEAETCKVRSKLTYDHRTMKGVTTPVTETWVIERGQPYFVFPTG